MYSREQYHSSLNTWCERVSHPIQVGKAVNHSDGRLGRLACEAAEDYELLLVPLHVISLPKNVI